MSQKWKDDKSPRRFAEMSANVQIEINTLKDDVPTWTAQIFVPQQNKHKQWRDGVVDQDRPNYPDERMYAIHSGTTYTPQQIAKKKDANGVVAEDDLTQLIRMVKEIEGLPAVAGDPPLPEYKGLFPGLWAEFHSLFNKGIDLYRQNENADPPQSSGHHTFAELLANVKIDAGSGELRHPFWLPPGDHARDRHRPFLNELGARGMAGDIGAIEKMLMQGDHWTGGMQGTVANNGMDPADTATLSAAANVVVKLTRDYDIWTLLDGHFRGATKLKPDDTPAP